VIDVMNDSEDGNKYICLEAKIKINANQFSILRRWVNYNDATTFMIEGPSVISQQNNNSDNKSDNDDDNKGDNHDDDKMKKIIESSTKNENDIDDIDNDDDGDDDLSPFYGGRVSIM